MRAIEPEKRKLAEYVCNMIACAKKSTNYKELYEWFEDHGCEIFNVKYVEIKYRNATSCNEKKLRNFLINAGKQIRYRYLKNDGECSDYESTLNFIAKTIDMTKPEKEYLGLIAHSDLDYDIEHFFDHICDNKFNFKNIPDILSQKLSFSILRQTRLKLLKTGLVERKYHGEQLELTSFGKMIFNEQPSSYNNFQNLFFGKKQTASLKWDDFAYIEKRDEVCALLKEAAARKEKGVNILFYGVPGTGKTEFSRTLACKAGVKLYAVKGPNGYDNDDEDKDMKYRQAALLFSQKLVANQKNVCLLLDEAEDVFFNTNKTKLCLNTMLEENATPVIWTTNRTIGMDPAFLRRFNYSIHFEIPEEEHCIRIWQKILRQNKLPAKAKTAAELYKEYAVPPAFIANAAKIERLIGGGIETVKSSLDNMRELCTGKKKQKDKNKESPSVPFDPHLLNTDTDLEKLAEQIKELSLNSFSLCLYGAPGTGKSAYAVWLAEKLKMPVLKKRCSDLLSMYVGGTEANIRNAFAEAAKKKAVLIFDEADSFLQDRRNAVRSWETTQVNEMLTQMESAEHPFICTTNLLDVLDQASLRRFTFKVKYDFMTAEQRSKAFATFFGFRGVSLADMENLTPADFALVHKKASILGVLKDKKELLKMLTAEQTIKAPPKHKLGF